MRFFFLKLRTSISIFVDARKKLFGRIYWTLAILALAFVIIMPIYTGIIGFHDPLTSPPATRLTAEELREIREIQGNLRAYWQDVARANDFAWMMWLMEANFPFYGLAERQGVDITELAVQGYAILTDPERAEDTPLTLMAFVNTFFLPHFDGLGQLRLTAPQATLTPWIVEPYYMGHFDQRFNNPNLDIPTKESNFATRFLSDNVAHIIIDSFLQKGYEQPGNAPFWHYQIATERLLLNSFFRNLDADHLIIDIRGYAEGFAEYFLPFLLEMNISETVSADFFAFHKDGDFAMATSIAFRDFHGFGDLYPAGRLEANMSRRIPQDFAQLAYGFIMPMAANPATTTPSFGGKIWLLTDSCNFSGPNQMYLSLAQMAGFTILYAENPNSPGWPAPYTILPNSRLLLRHNVFYFTDIYGHSLEEFYIVPHINLNTHTTYALDAAHQHIIDNH